MATLAAMGFETNDVTGGTGHEFSVVTGSPTIASTGARTGTYCGTVTSLTSGAQKFFQYNFRSSNVSTDTYVQFYLFITSYPNVKTSIAGYIDNVNNISSGLQLSTTGVLTMSDNNGTTIATSSALSTGVWHRIAHRQFNTSTTLELRIDGVSIGSSTSAATQVYEGYVLGGNIGGETATTINIAFDDWVINDTSGSSQTSWPPDQHLLAVVPSGAGDSNTFGTQTGGTAGAANNYTRVKEVTADGATSFNGSNTNAQSDLYAMTGQGGTVPAGATVNFVQVNFIYRASVASAEAAIKTQVEKTTGGTKGQSSAITPNSTTFKLNANAAPSLPPQTLYTDPDGGAWTATTIGTMQVGMTISTGNTNRADVTKIWAMVGYTPAATGNISKISGVADASLLKVAGVADASISKVAGVAGP